METLRYGDTGTEVQLLQLALSRAGYREIQALDGIFGNDTQRALERFQANHQLGQDGIAGSQTWAQLLPWLLGYRRVTLRKGDTFYRLAQRYGSTLRAIETANPQLDPLRLQIGQSVIVPLSFTLVPTEIPMTFKLLEFCVIGLKARYPFLHVRTPGMSVMGKPIYFVHLGSGAGQVFFNAAHHANEWITSTLLMTWLENTAQALAMDEQILGQPASEVLARASAWLAPMVNPDGAGFLSHAIDIICKKTRFPRFVCAGIAKSSFYRRVENPPSTLMSLPLR